MSSVQVVVMGVSATGKSTVAQAVAAELGWTFVEGDDLHPRRNVARMASGEPLTDEDRAPWLDAVNRVAREHSAEGRGSVITCSALKRAYRDRLRDGVDAMFFVHLHADHDVLEPRMRQREKHFMPAGLLRSQLDTLEPLGDDEDGAVVDVTPGSAEVVDEVLRVVRARCRA